MPRFHLLKTWPEPFYHVMRTDKRFEYRRNDRGFKVGDILILAQYDPQTKLFDKGSFVDMEVTYILSDGQFELPADMCIMSLRSAFIAYRDVEKVYWHMMNNNLLFHETP